MLRNYYKHRDLYLHWTEMGRESKGCCSYGPKFTSVGQTTLCMVFLYIMNTIRDYLPYCTAGAEPNDGNGGSEQEEQVTCSFVAN